MGFGFFVAHDWIVGKYAICDVKSTENSQKCFE